MKLESKNQNAKMKIGLVSTTVAIACLASSAEARIGTSRNLVDKNTVEGAILDSAGTNIRGVVKIDLIKGVATASVSTSSQKQETATKEQHLEDKDNASQEVSQEDPKALPSFDQVMHKDDTPKHGVYVEGGSNRMDSFCARHNHFGPNSGCEQHHASLRGGRVGRGKVTAKTSEDSNSESYLQKHVHEAQSQHQSRSQQRQSQRKQPPGRM